MTLSFARGQWSLDGVAIDVQQAIAKDAGCARISARYMLKLGLSILIFKNPDDYAKLSRLLKEYQELECTFLDAREMFLVQEALDYMRSVEL